VVKISIIIPCYNCEKYIDETLKCLENQTYKEFEVICINDGSTDNTLLKLNEWRKKGVFNFKIIEQQNSGVSTARNNGIDNANGDYLLFLDSDDTYHSRFIELLYNTIEESNTDTVYCRLSRKQSEVMCQEINAYKYEIQTQDQAMNTLLFRMGEIGFYNFIFRKEILDGYKLRFDVNTKYGEDREFNWKYLTHCKKIGFINLALYWYRVNNNSVTQKKATPDRPNSLQVIRRIESYLLEYNCPFYEIFCDYMYARCVWAIAKAFAVSKEKGLFLKFVKEYDAKKYMKRTAKDNNWLVCLASRLFLIHPMLFYYSVGMKR